MDTPLRIAAFKDFSCFLLESDPQNRGFDAVITFVEDANEAHRSLQNQTADLVFMSYDDTLSMVFQENYPDIRAVLPVHGGMLDLSGKIDLSANKKTIGIDTDTGYARALRFYFKKQLPPKEYDAIEWKQIGATNLRYDKLLAGEVDATLLNPPFSYKPGSTGSLNLFDAIGDYQGVVVNAQQSWLDDAVNRERLKTFAGAFYGGVRELRAAPQEATAAIQKFYGLSEAEAAAIYGRLWHQDGLSSGSDFDLKKLEGTEKIFAADTGTDIFQPRTWIAETQPS